MNFLAELKALIIGILVSAISVSPSVAPRAATPLSSPATSPQATVSPAANTEDVYNINGTYTYWGQSIDYHLQIPKNGGAITGNISGACGADLVAKYSGGEGGQISGTAEGKCKFLFVSYSGKIPFKGNFYPQQKKIVIELEGAKVSPVTLNYN